MLLATPPLASLLTSRLPPDMEVVPEYTFKPDNFQVPESILVTLVLNPPPMFWITPLISAVPAVAPRRVRVLLPVPDMVMFPSSVRLPVPACSRVAPELLAKSITRSVLPVVPTYRNVEADTELMLIVPFSTVVGAPRLLLALPPATRFNDCTTSVADSIVVLPV